MKKMLLMASLLVLAPALAANAATKKPIKHKQKTTSHPLPGSQYIAEDQLPAHLNIHLPSQAADEDKKANSASVGVAGDLDFKSQDRGNGFRGKGYNKPSVGAFQLSGKARVGGWVDLNATGTYRQEPQSDHTSNHFNLDELYATIGNFYKTPFYLNIGYQYLPFGVYEPYSLTGSVTKQLSEAQSTLFGLGFDKSNFYGLVYFHGQSGDVNKQHFEVQPSAENFGAEAGYTWTGFHQGLHINSSYLNNFREVSIISNLKPENLNRVGAMSIHGSYFYGRYGVMADYTFATNEFNSAAMSYNGSDAQPSALFGEAYVRFQSFKLPSAIGFGYGESWQTLALQMPKSRLMLNYSLLLNKHFSLQLQYTHAKDFSTSDTANMNRQGDISVTNGTGNTINAYQIRLSFGFGNEQPEMYTELEGGGY